jgi:hypothetical protein
MLLKQGSPGRKVADGVDLAGLGGCDVGQRYWQQTAGSGPGIDSSH